MPISRRYFVYILTNKYNTVFYIGVTNNLEKRIHEHANKLVESFTKKYKLYKLIYYEEYIDIRIAIEREKQLKNWHRSWKINLIKKTNPNFLNLLGDAEINSA